MSRHGRKAKIFPLSITEREVGLAISTPVPALQHSGFAIGQLVEGVRAGEFSYMRSDKARNLHMFSAQEKVMNEKPSRLFPERKPKLIDLLPSMKMPRLRGF